MVNLEIDLGDAFEELTQIEEGLEPALERILDRGAEIGLQIKLREIAKTDARPIPTNKQVNDYKRDGTKTSKRNVGQNSKSDSTKPAWKRTGAWAEGQKIEKPERFVRDIVDSGKAAEPITNYPGGYAEKLSKLETGSLGVNRTNKAAENARDKTEEQIEAIIEQELLNVLNL